MKHPHQILIKQSHAYKMQKGGRLKLKLIPTKSFCSDNTQRIHKGLQKGCGHEQKKKNNPQQNEVINIGRYRGGIHST